MNDAQAAVIVEWVRRFDAAGIEHWLFGGWAVDHHAGRVTSPHDDVDFVIWTRDHDTVIEMLGAAGFAPLRPSLAFIRNGVEFEITLIDRAQDGAIVTPGFEDWPWDAGTFGDDFRALNGYPVRVVSIAGLLAVKTEWELHFGESPRPQDLADAQILQALLADN
jgi:hypothetical protein